MRNDMSTEDDAHVLFIFWLMLNKEEDFHKISVQGSYLAFDGLLFWAYNNHIDSKIDLLIHC